MVRASGRRLDGVGRGTTGGGPRGRSVGRDGLRTTGSEEALARRRGGPIGGLHGPGVLGGVPDPGDRGIQRRHQGRGHGGTAGRGDRGHRRLRAGLDRRAVREEDPRGGRAVRLRVERPGLERRRVGGLALLRRDDHPDDGPRGADRRVRARHPAADARRGRRHPADLALGRRVGDGAVRGPVPRRAALHAGPAHPRADLRRRRPGVLHQGDRRPRLPERLRDRLQARIVTVRVVGDLLRRPVRRADLRRLRDGREPCRGGGRAEAADPQGRADLGHRGLALLPGRLLRRGGGVRLRPRQDLRRRRCGAVVRAVGAQMRSVRT